MDLLLLHQPYDDACIQDSYLGSLACVTYPVKDDEQHAAIQTPLNPSRSVTFKRES